ncbi:hypothetical protein B0H13DRAFT_2359461 [Mycena leptocephala]|nr:hypothetical protein B0H13DRAFT_2359461 [Mycena leptocephala]
MPLRVLSALALACAQDDVISIGSVVRPTDPVLSTNLSLPRRSRLSELASKSNDNGKIAGGVVATLATPRAPTHRLLHPLALQKFYDALAQPRQRWLLDVFAPAGVGKHHMGMGMGQVYACQPLVGYDYWQDIKVPVAEPLFVREPGLGSSWMWCRCLGIGASRHRAQSKANGVFSLASSESV